MAECKKRADDMMRLNRPSDAVEKLTTALNLYENKMGVRLKAELYYDRALANGRMKRQQESLQDARECVKADKTWSKVR